MIFKGEFNSDLNRTVFNFGEKRANYHNHSSPKKLGFKDIILPSDFKILIIDDDVDFLNALKYRLTKKKIDVVPVRSGYHALEVLNENYFDLILLDLKMKGMDGVETFKKIRKIEPQPFVIIMTAHFKDDQVEIVKKLKPFGFLNKPFDLDELAPLIKKRIEEKNDGN